MENPAHARNEASGNGSHSDSEYDYEDREECELQQIGGGATAAPHIPHHHNHASHTRTPNPPPPGPTPYAVSLVSDIPSAFELFFTRAIRALVLEMTNLHAERTGYGLRYPWWKAGMGEAELRAYAGLLILTGVYRSRGEAAASLWDAESGRSIFRATMPLKAFYAYSTLLRFDDRETRAQRRSSDKLAAVRELWDRWADMLPYMYNPGPDVTVDEQLVPFRGRCPFRQYMPSKPAKYGIKSWVLCDAKSSYAWKMQVYLGKNNKPATPARPKKNQGARVVLDLTVDLLGPRNVTCDNFFTSYELGQRLLDANLTMLGTVRKNRPELPPALISAKGRAAFSSEFAFATGPGPGGHRTTTLVSYVPKKNKNVLVMTTLPWHSRTGGPSSSASASSFTASGLSERPELVLKYNATKGGVDNLDKLVATYSCRRMTSRWPVAVFHNILDVSAYNAYVIWRETNPGWLSGHRNKRRFFLEQLGKALVAPLIEKRRGLPRSEASLALVRCVRTAASANTNATGARCESRPHSRPHPHPQPPSREEPSETGSRDRTEPLQQQLQKLQASKRKRCQICPAKKDSKTFTTCRGCSKYVCRSCALPYCPSCV
ncbi:piggyBac transposable element-derived protein 4-like [Micropterus dolomieu]|uniref:piggyBac transposable element-derived protein 4-like n=1 Tax=Micropterus dolomieu TaxID=147949 RepID=UPI001E8DEFD4|nr:piggyBac transposable element-derived protein 4-like [Micropterus dolomieu]